VTRLYRAAWDEVSRTLPELRAALLETKAARCALFAAVRDGARGEDLLGPGRRLVGAMRDVAAQVTLLEGGPEPATPAGSPTIHWLGDRLYRVGSREQIVNDTEDALLQAFLGQPTLDLRGLVRRTNLDRGHLRIALGRLRKKWGGMFAGAVHCPGRKGSGYHARVVDARPGAGDGPGNLS
jgi:hypothetical protein